MCSAVIDGNSSRGPLPFTASAKLPQRVNGTGGKVLALNLLQIGGKPKLVMLATTTAVFSGRCGRVHPCTCISGPVHAPMVSWYGGGHMPSAVLPSHPSVVIATPTISHVHAPPEQPSPCTAVLLPRRQCCTSRGDCHHCVRPGSQRDIKHVAAPLACPADPSPALLTE